MLVFDKIGRKLADYLIKQRPIGSASPATPPDLLLSCLRPCDVLLVEGKARISSAIKYLTQSTWSHAALFVGDTRAPTFIEVDLVEGVREVGVAAFDGLHTRICRPVGLREEECMDVVRFARSRLGNRYDLRNIIDLVRYLLPNPPVPTFWRRRMLALGSGDPTRAICSTLIAQAFESIRYPILPEIEKIPAYRADCPDCVREILHIRHHSLITPRDFDVSPYFQIVKPTLEGAFDYRTIQWSGEDMPAKWRKRIVDD